MSVLGDPDGRDDACAVDPGLCGAGDRCCGAGAGRGGRCWAGWRRGCLCLRQCPGSMPRWTLKLAGAVTGEVQPDATATARQLSHRRQYRWAEAASLQTHVFAPIDIGSGVARPHPAQRRGDRASPQRRAMHRIIAAFTAEPAAAEPIVRAERARYLVAMPRTCPKCSVSRKRRPAAWRRKLVRGKAVDWLMRDRRSLVGLASASTGSCRRRAPSADAKCWQRRNDLLPSS